jgi:hypothetical protein
MARIRGEGLPRRPPRAGARPGLQLEELAMFFFVAVPVVGAVLTGLFGRKLGLAADGGRGRHAAWWLTASVLLARPPASWPCCSWACSASARPCGAPAAAAAAWHWWRLGRRLAAAAAVGRRRRGLLVRRRRRLRRRRRVRRLVMGLSMNRLARILRHRWLDETDARRALDDAALDRLEARVAASERRHSGEIRVCVEAGLPLSYLWRGLRRATVPSRCSASCACGTPRPTTAC